MSVDTSNKIIRKRCLDCHYALDYLTTDRCPECGREFDHLNPATWWDVVTDPPLERARKRLAVGITVVALLDGSFFVIKVHSELLFMFALIAHFALTLLGIAELAGRPWRIKLWALGALGLGLWPFVCILIGLTLLAFGFGP